MWLGRICTLGKLIIVLAKDKYAVPSDLRGTACMSVKKVNRTVFAGARQKSNRAVDKKNTTTVQQINPHNILVNFKI